jgi:hypothetical protein
MLKSEEMVMQFASHELLLHRLLNTITNLETDSYAIDPLNMHSGII